MINIEKIVNGAYYIINWDEPTKLYEEFQDCWESNKDGIVCKITIQLLYNSESKIIDHPPKVLDFIEKNEIETLTLKISDFLDKNDNFDNLTQILYEDCVLFSYVADFESLNFDYLNIYKLTNGLFIVLDDNMKIKCIVINTISSFNYIDLGVGFDDIDKELKINFIKLYFRIYTYDQYNHNEINKLIYDINDLIFNNNLNNSILDFFLLEIENLKDEL